MLACLGSHPSLSARHPSISFAPLLEPHLQYQALLPEAAMTAGTNAAAIMSKEASTYPIAVLLGKHVLMRNKRAAVAATAMRESQNNAAASEFLHEPACGCWYSASRVEDGKPRSRVDKRQAASGLAGAVLLLAAGWR